MHGAFSAHILDITCKYKYISSGILVQNAYRYKKKQHIIINTSSINIFISAYAGHVC
jgi:hypothetical protein